MTPGGLLVGLDAVLLDAVLVRADLLDPPVKPGVPERLLLAWRPPALHGNPDATRKADGEDDPGEAVQDFGRREVHEEESNGIGWRNNPPCQPVLVASVSNIRTLRPNSHGWLFHLPFG